MLDQNLYKNLPKKTNTTFSSATNSLNTLFTRTLTAHPQDPVDGLQQEVHVVMSSDASEHVDLLGEALKTQRNKTNKTPVSV